MITFILADKNRSKSAINIVIEIGTLRLKKSLKVSVIPKNWNIEKRRVRVTSENIDENHINDIICQYEYCAKLTIFHFEKNRLTPTREEFWQEFEKKINNVELISESENSKDGQSLFLEYFSSFIKKYDQKKTIAAIKKYTTCYNKLNDYSHARKIKIRFCDINNLFYFDFKEWFYKEGFSTNYFGNCIQVIKQVFDEARDLDEIHSLTLKKYKDFVSKRVDVDAIYLTKQEIDKIFNLIIDTELLQGYYPNIDKGQLKSKEQHYNHVRDLFLIGCYTGLRVSDFSRLAEADISGDYFRIKAKKTDTTVVVPKSSNLKIILDRIDIQKTVFAQKINIAIKDIARIAKIDHEVTLMKSTGGERVVERYKKWELVCTHTARRSFATNAYKANVPTISIMKITGHTKEATFMKYIKISELENAELLSKHDFFK